MAIVGRKPKPEGQQRHGHKPLRGWLEVEDRAFRGRHPLPASMPDGRPWPDATRSWWRVVSTMPHCRLWSRADWQFALDTALTAAAFHGGDMKLATELRIRDRAMGTTLEARLNLRIRYVEPQRNEQLASVTAIEDYRRMVEE